MHKLAVMNDAHPAAQTETAGERRPVRILDLLLPLVAIIVFVAVAIAAMVGYAFGHGNEENSRALISGLSTNFIAAQLFMALIYLAMLSGIWLVARRHGPATVAGYFSHVPRHTVVWSILAGVGMAALVLTAIWWLGSHTDVTFRATRSEEKLLVAHNPLEFAVSLAVIAVIAPFTEELYFRGLLLAWLRRWLWLPAAAITDASVFGLVHGRYVNHPGLEGWILTVMVAFVGLLNVYWFTRARSLWPAFLTHAFYNGALVTLAYAGS